MLTALRIAVELIEPDSCQKQAGDMNGDGIIDSTDAIMIQRLALGLSVNPQKSLAGPIEKAGTPVSIYIDEVTAMPGETVSIPVFIDDATGLGACDVTVSFSPDEESLTLQSLESGSLTENFNMASNEERLGSAVTSMCYEQDALAEGSGSLFTIELTVGEDVPAGSEFPIGLNSVELKDEFGRSYAWSRDVEKSGGILKVLVPATIICTVVEAGSLTPVENATVSVDPGRLSTTQNVDGVYVLTGLTAGTYTVSADASGYDPSTPEFVTVTTGGQEAIVIELTSTSSEEEEEGEGEGEGEDEGGGGCAGGTGGGSVEDMIVMAMALAMLGGLRRRGGAARR